jgi:hypothetical protein
VYLRIIAREKSQTKEDSESEEDQLSLRVGDQHREMPKVNGKG